ncbi:MAG: SDR family NAD(P)-dependent oxidoreductase [Rhodobiaceae bacterium]|nr:SDR family NAD(P)-dependent oxidoreductase [Rhodobiaceae bacterium]MCC0054638.1 SDR family NAD(P)-dependent oxidoreductase [Rhodobiaceae bacterium]
MSAHPAPRRKAGGAPEHIVITGASGGLGRALAEAYAVPGRLLSLAGRDAPRLEQAAAACMSRGAEVSTRIIDVTNADAMEEWLSARDAARPVDLLVSSTGIGGDQVVPGPSGETGEQANRIFAINTLGAVNAVTPLLPSMVVRGKGHIVLIGSVSGLIGMPQSPAYCASKSAVHIYGDSLRRLVRQRGVGVTVVMPGFIDTPMSRSLDMPRPFCWSAEKAARRIVRDVARGARRSIFPWPLRFVIGLQNYAPVAATDWVMQLTTRGWQNAADR